MALFDFRGTADAMADLLDRERNAILKGRFDLLERIVPEKERLTTHLSPGDVDDKTIASLRQKAAHNARLLEAVRIGLKDAHARMQMIRRGPDDLHTYDATGRRTALGPSPSVKQVR